MTVRDSWDVLDRSGEATVWDLERTSCSLEDCLQLIDQSLLKFTSEKPDARIESMGLEMQVVRDIWKDILTELHGTLGKLSGEKHASRTETPSEVDQAIHTVVDKSSGIAAIRSQLNTQGLAVHAVMQCNQIIFKDSLAGRTWHDIGSMPGVGILFPGMIEFTFN